MTQPFHLGHHAWFDSWRALRQSHKDGIISAGDVAAREWSSLRIARKEQNRMTGCDFNALRFFDISENRHSFLLGYLLAPHAAHGQGNLFISTFLAALGIADPGRGRWQLTIGKQYLDLALVRADPFSVVIIENKSNYAADQTNQLYYYWYYHIQVPAKRNMSDGSDRRYHRIVYLAPSHYKRPSHQTSQRHPSCHQCADAPPEIPQGIVTVWDYPDQVALWLRQCAGQLPPLNHRLREYVLQYVELWR